MNQREAFKATLELAWERGMHFVQITPEAGTDYRHLVSMHDRMSLDPGMSDSKIGRWLGWAQASVVASGVASLDEMKAINKSYADSGDHALTKETLSSREIKDELRGLADSLDYNVTREQVYDALVALWRKV